MGKKKNRGRGGSTGESPQQQQQQQEPRQQSRPSGQPVEDFPSLTRGGASRGGQQGGRGRGQASPVVPTQDDFPGLGAPVGRGRGAWGTPSPQASAVQGGVAGSGVPRGGAQPPFGRGGVGAPRGGQQPSFGRGAAGTPHGGQQPPSGRGGAGAPRGGQQPPFGRGGAGAARGSPHSGQGPAGGGRGRGRGASASSFSADEGSPASHASSPAPAFHTPPQSTPGSQASPSVAWGASPMQTPPQKPEQAISSAMGAMSLGAQEAAKKPGAGNGHKNVKGITALSKMEGGQDESSPEVIPKLRQKGKYPGTEGVQVMMEVNHFEMTCTQKIFTYNIEVQPPWDREFRKSDELLYFLAFQQWKRINQGRLKNEFGWVFNGRNMIFSHYPGVCFPDVEVEVQDPVSEKPHKFQITGVRQVQENDVTSAMELFQKEGRGAFNAGNEGGLPSTELAALDNILTQFVKTSRYVKTVGKSFFPRSNLPMDVLDVGFGKEVWIGSFTAVRPFGWKSGDICLTLNVDVAHKAAVKSLDLTPREKHQSPRDCYINRLFEKDYNIRGNVDFRRPLDGKVIDVINKDLTGLKVRYEIGNIKRSYRVNKLVDPANRMMVSDQGKTVEAYFRDERNVKLKYPHLPCLWVGSLNKTIYIPMELCRLENEPLPRSKKLNDDSVATMIRQTACTPADRKKKIMRNVQEGMLTKENDFLKIFGITIENHFLQVTGRVLPPPSLAYSGYNAQKKTQEVVQVKASMNGVPGSWRVNERHLYRDAMAIDVIKVFNIGLRNERDQEEFLRTLRSTGNENGVTTREVGYYARRSNNIDEELVKCYQEAVRIKKNKKSVLIVVILERKGSDHYEKIKFLGDKTYGIPSQCVVWNTLFSPKRPGCNKQVLQNLWLKINSKMGGRNFTLHNSVRPAWLSKPCMIMGADVSHAAPESKGQKPSIVAVVGSTDPAAVQYNCSIRIQGQGQGKNEEIIQDMKEITRELLLKFYKDNKGYKPTKLVMFRDGVSEGQFHKVLNAELKAIRAACTSLGDGSYKPPITYIVVQKRHHTRFFPENKNYTYQRSGNAYAGTVLDQGLNHPTEGDFYLLSHEGIQGTARPTHYHVLWDDSMHTADDLEKTTFYLCHLYSRCTRSVSYPAPTYYAHLAADRARKHHNEMLVRKMSPDAIKAKMEDGSVPLMYFV